MKNYFETVSPLILAALLKICILWTVSVLLWIMTIIDFNYRAFTTGKNTEEIKPRIRYVCDTSKSFIYYATRGGEDKSKMPISRDKKWSNQNP